MARTQVHRPIAVATPLGDEKVLLKGLSVTEQLSRPFRIELDLLSTDSGIDPLKILGQRVTVRVEFPQAGTRYFNGHVSRWDQTAAGVQGSSELARYRATLVPWLWLLTRTANCRIFQAKSIPDIVQQIFRDSGFSDFQLSLSGDYQPVEYCVQYRETDFNFVSRLLEHVGIYYYFKHENKKHTLVLADSPSAHTAAAGYETIRYMPPSRVAVGHEVITDWSTERRVQPGKYVHTAYDFTKPDTNLESRSRGNVVHAGSAFEVFDYPGEYDTVGVGETLAKIRVEEMLAEHETAQGETGSRGAATGHKFTLNGHPRDDQNKDWLITGTTIHAESDPFESNASGVASTIYRCTLTAVDATVHFRPSRVTPKPVISGPQTAIVSGPAKKEIWTDEHGRIKVQFHWDREATGDEKTSCWLRVAQAWAGKKFGAVFTPRIGHEVIVEFLEGDPDRPIVTGCVYNARESHPYEFPGGVTRSGVKTNTTKPVSSSAGGGGDAAGGGGEAAASGFNEIRFEDLKDQEQLFIHAQRNQDNRVLNDSLEWVGNNRHLIIKKDQVELVEQDRHEHVKRHHQETIDQNRHLHVKGQEAKLVEKTLSLTVTEDVAEVFKKNHSETVTEDLYFKAKNIVIEADENLTLKAGNKTTYIAMTSDGAKVGSDGEIYLDAKKDITQKTQANFVAEATSNMTLKGMAVTVEGTTSAEVKSPSTTVKSDGTLVLKGALVNIN